MNAPKHLKHKPIVAVNNYHQIDGKYAKNTDAFAMSVGKAQYDNNDISAKLWRHTGGKWSRQSEELPIHRVLDMATLVAGAYTINPEISMPSTYLGETVEDPEGMKQLLDHYNSNGSMLKEKMMKLKDALDRAIDKL